MMWVSGMANSSLQCLSIFGEISSDPGESLIVAFIDFFSSLQLVGIINRELG